MRRVNVSQLEYTYDESDPEGFRSGMARFGPDLGAAITGATAYDIPPGQALCPYHYEYGEEEWLLVLEGRASIRTPEGTEEAGPMDLVFFPRGPEGAHGVRNETDGPVRVLMWSNVVVPTGTAYPDSGKVALWTGDKAEDVMVPRSAHVEYFHGE